MVKLILEFHDRDGLVQLRSTPVRDLVIGGCTGRDRDKVEEHIAELKALGVAPPASVPCFYPAGAELLTTAETIDCLGAESSGEAEYFLLIRDDGWWVGAGSDHTDRDVETYSITVSKQMCPKPVAPLLWRWADVADHWDRLEIRSWVDDGAGLVPYQTGTVAAMRDPRDLIAAYEAAGRRLGLDTVLFGGTLPVQGGIRPRRVFRFELRDPVRERSIDHTYTARWLPV